MKRFLYCIKMNQEAYRLAPKMYWWHWLHNFLSIWKASGDKSSMWYWDMDGVE